MTVIPYDDRYRDALISMVSAARAAMGLDPAVREDLYDVRANYIDKGDMFWQAIGDEGEVLGCLGFSRTGESEAFLHRFYVRATLKRRGIGSELLAVAENYMKSRGIAVSRVHLGGDEKVWFESYRFYPKHGYVLYAPRYMKKEL